MVFCQILPFFRNFTKEFYLRTPLFLDFWPKKSRNSKSGVWRFLNVFRGLGPLCATRVGKLPSSGGILKLMVGLPNLFGIMVVERAIRAVALGFRPT